MNLPNMHKVVTIKIGHTFFFYDKLPVKNVTSSFAVFSVFQHYLHFCEKAIGKANFL